MTDTSWQYFLWFDWFLWFVMIYLIVYDLIQFVLHNMSWATEEECFRVPKEIALISPFAALTANGITTSWESDMREGCICPLVMDPFRSLGDNNLWSHRGEGFGARLLSRGVGGTIPLLCILPEDPRASSIALYNEIK